jgi:ribosome-interacting GTPase 1
MPTNLPPDYFAIEKEYRQATSPEEKIALLEEMYSVVPKHKGTDHLRADIRRRIAKLKTTAQTSRRTSRQTSVFQIDTEGAGQVVIAGVTNVGKSALVAALTNAEPEVAESPFTTWTPTPGMMPIEDIQVQLIDTPPLSKDYVEPELMNLIRRADLLLLVVDLQGFPIEQIEDALAILGEHRIVPYRLRVLGEHRIVPYRLREQYAGERRMTFVPTLILVNKCDDERAEGDYEVLCELLEGEWPLVPVSATTGRNFDGLKKAVFDRLEIMRVYSKPPGQKPDLGAPFVMKRGSTVEELAGKVHKDFLEKLSSARVWGSAEYDGQMVGRDHVLCDGDVVELRI